MRIGSVFGYWGWKILKVTNPFDGGATTQSFFFCRKRVLYLDVNVGGENPLMGNAAVYVSVYNENKYKCFAERALCAMHKLLASHIRSTSYKNLLPLLKSNGIEIYQVSEATGFFVKNVRGVLRVLVFV